VDYPASAQKRKSLDETQSQRFALWWIGNGDNLAHWGAQVRYHPVLLLA
jgi:hypothetical protein